jgi:putative phage-type endonuclease
MRVYMNREKWLNWRLDGIGASDAPVVMGLSPWKTPYELWEEKVNRVVSQKTNWAMERGIEMEDTARRAFEKEMSTIVFPENMVHPEYPFLRCSLDGLCIDKKIAVEIKCPGVKDHLTATTGQVPEKYYPQLQHQMFVSGLDHIYYFSFYDNKGVVVFVKRDNLFIEKMLKMEMAFWKNVQEKTPPPKTDKDVKSIENKEWEELCLKRQELTDRISEMEKEADRIKEQLIKLAEGESAKGSGFLLQKQNVKGSIDYKAFSKENPQISFEEYRKDSYEKWVLRSLVG